MDEVFMTLLDLSRDKALGPDDFPLLFGGSVGIL